jgi:methionine-rich copper-binding protein CopC
MGGRIGMRHAFSGLIRYGLVAPALLGLWLALSDQGAAHSLLIESVPAHGAKLVTAPPSAMLRFNARIEPALTRVSLLEGQQRRTALEISKESAVDRIIVPLPPLTPGLYSLAYKVLAVDGHVTRGLIQFTVLPAGVSP